MLRRFIRDGGIYGISSVLTKGIGLLLLPIYTRALTPAEYGVVDLLQVVRSFVALTVALEITQGLVRFFPEARSDTERRALASTAFWFTLATHALFAGAAPVWARPLSAWLFGSPEMLGPFRLAVGYVVLAGFFSLVQEQLRFELRAKAYAAASIVSVVTIAVVSAVLLFGTGLRISAVLLGLIAGNAAGLAVSWYLARGRYALVFDWQKCRQMLAFGAPLVVSGLGVFVALFADRLAIRQLLGIHHLGIYAVGLRLAWAPSLLMMGVQMALIPLIYTHHAESGTPREVARILRLVLLAFIPAIVLLGLFGPELIRALSTPEYLPAASVIPLLAAGVILSQFWVFAPGLGLAKRTPVIALLNTSAAAVNVALNFLLIPFLGLMGAALATFSASVLTASGYVMLGRRYYHVPYEWPRIAAAVAFGAGALVVAAAVWGTVPASSLLAWSGKVGLALLAIVMIGAVLVGRHELAGARLVLARRLRIA
jgi:O-antigen/teichoic acid export membrane protein